MMGGCTCEKVCFLTLRLELNMKVYIFSLMYLGTTVDPHLHVQKTESQM